MVLPVQTRGEGKVPGGLEGAAQGDEVVAVAQVEGVLVLEQHVEELVLVLGQVRVLVVDVVQGEAPAVDVQAEARIDAGHRVRAMHIPPVTRGVLLAVPDRAVPPRIGHDAGIAVGQVVSGHHAGVASEGCAALDPHEATLEVVGSVGDDVDDPGEGVCAVDGAAGPLDDFHLLDHGQRDVLVQPGVGVDAVVPGHPVHEDQDFVVVRRGDAPNPAQRAALGAGREIDARNHAKHIREGPAASLPQLGVRVDRDDGGCLTRRLCVSTGDRDDALFEHEQVGLVGLREGVDGLGGEGKGEQERR